MKEKNSQLLLNILRVFLVTMIMFFGFSWLIYYVFYNGGPFAGWVIGTNESYFQILNRFFTYNWLDTTDPYPIRDVFLTKLPGTRDLAFLSLLCGGIPGLVSGLRKCNEKQKSRVLHFVSLGFVIPLGILLSFLSMYTGIFPAGGYKGLTMGFPTVYTGSRLIDSLLNLEFLYFVDTLWHLVLPTICLSFVTYCLILWLIKGIKKDVTNLKQNWQRINIRVLVSYVVFNFMIMQANRVFNIGGVDIYFLDRLAYRDPAIVMIALFYLMRVMGVYIITNISLIIISCKEHKNSRVERIESVETQTEKFIHQKPNKIIMIVLGIMALGYAVLFFLSLLPTFHIIPGASLVSQITWGVRDSTMSGLISFILTFGLSVVVLFPIAKMRNSKQSIKTLPLPLEFLLQFGRDLLLFLFIPFCILGYNHQIIFYVLWGFSGNWIRNVATFSIPFAFIIILSLNVRRIEHKKINMKELILKILGLNCLLTIIILIFNDTLGNGGTFILFLPEEGWTFWMKLGIRWPLANLTQRSLLLSEPFGVIIACLIIWSFYAFWTLGFILLKRIQVYRKPTIQSISESAE